MNIDKIRNLIKNNLGNLYMFKFNGTRNQTEEFVGKIQGAYKSIFIIKVNDYTNRIRSFSYSDILTNTLEMKEFILKK